MRVAVLKSSTHRLLILLILVEVPLVGTLVEEDTPVCIYMHTLMRDAEGKKKEASKVYVYMYICIYMHSATSVMHKHTCLHMYMYMLLLACCVALPCCLFDLACFFLPSFSSLILKMHILARMC